MIPSIKEILFSFKQGVPLEQCLRWIEQHIELAVQKNTKEELFQHVFLTLLANDKIKTTEFDDILIEAEAATNALVNYKLKEEK